LRSWLNIKIKYLTTTDVIYLHDYIIYDYYKGFSEEKVALGVISIPLLESALANPKAGMFDQEFYPTIYDKAAILLETLIFNHPFVDGNKRTAMCAAEMFMHLNGYALNIAPLQFSDFCLNIAQEKIKIEEIISFFKKRSIEQT
jgi:death on curing protein